VGLVAFQARVGRRNGRGGYPGGVEAIRVVAAVTPAAAVAVVVVTSVSRR